MDIAALLAGGSRRSIGRANEVVALVLAQPSLVPGVVAAMEAADPVVRMRAADVAEKVSAAQADLLAPHGPRLLALAEVERQSEPRWHLAQMLPRLGLAGRERARAIAVLEAYAEDSGTIVRVSALDALACLSERDAPLAARLLLVLRRRLLEGRPAERARCRRLLAALAAKSAEKACIPNDLP